MPNEGRARRQERRVWTFERLGEVLGGESGDRLTRLLWVALENEPPELGRAWEALTAFSCTHAPLEAVVRDAAGPPARRLAALGALLATSDPRLVTSVAFGANTSDLAVWAAALLRTEVETEGRPPLGSLAMHGWDVICMLCDHVEWGGRRGKASPSGSPESRLWPVSLRRALVHVPPPEGWRDLRNRVRTAAAAGVPGFEIQCREYGMPNECEWDLGRKLPHVVRRVSLDVDQMLLAAPTPAPASQPATAAEVRASLAALADDGCEEWIDQRTAARFLGVEVRTLQGYDGESGFPPSRREGRRKLYPVLALIRWAQATKRLCRVEELPERERLALLARLHETRTVSEDQAIHDELRKQRRR